MKDLTLDEMLEIAAEREAENEELLKQQQEVDRELARKNSEQENKH